MKIYSKSQSVSNLISRSFIRAGILFLTLCTIAIICLLYARFIEPKWIDVKTLSLSDTPTVTIIHISDIHFKGDDKYLSNVVNIINKIDADFVCFTGDLIEEKQYIADCMKILSSINKPLYGIAGNHDDWARVQKQDVEKQFSTTGGIWLERGDETTYYNKVTIVGETSNANSNTKRGMKTILLNHYPRTVNHLPENSYDLILAGHTHGGQVRIPFIGTPVIQESDKTYLRGLFHTKAGTLYVNSGIGTYYLPIRFRCRPEITIIKL